MVDRVAATSTYFRSDTMRCLQRQRCPPREVQALPDSDEGQDLRPHRHRALHSENHAQLSTFNIQVLRFTLNAFIFSEDP